MEQLLLIVAVCMLILGPTKTLSMAYWIGGLCGKLRRWLDECQRELKLSRIADLKGELTPELADLEGSMRKMSCELKSAMHDSTNKTNLPDATAMNYQAQTPPQATIKTDHSIQTAEASNGEDLKRRLEALEQELSELKQLLSLPQHTSTSNKSMHV